MVVFPITIDGRPAVAEIKAVEVESDKLHQALSGLVASVDRLEKQLASQARVTKEVTQATKEETKATEANAQATEKVEQAAKEAAAAKQAQRQALQRQREESRAAAQQNQRYAQSVDAVKRSAIGARGALLGMLAVGGLAVGVQGSIRLLGEYEEKTAILGVVSRATAEEQATLGRQARLLGESTRFTASQGVEAQIALARAGLSAQEVLGATPGVLALATVASVGLGDAATYVANSMRQFNIVAEQSQRITDGLVIVSNRANTDVRQMAEALAYAGPVANAAGRSFEETAAAIGVLGDAGITGSMGGTNLRGMLSDLLSRNDVTERALARMGLTFEQVNPLTQDLATLFETLRSRGFGAAEAIEIFGDRNAAAALVMSANVEKLRALTAAQREFSGESMKGAEIIEQNLKGALLGLASAAEGAILRKGGGLLGGLLRGVIDTGTDAIRVMFGLSQETSKVGVAGQVAAVGVTALAGALAALAAAKVVGSISALAAGLGSMIVPVRGMLSPIALLSPALIGLGAAAAGTYAIWNVFSDSMERSRLQMQELRKEAEGFRSSFESVESALARLDQAQEAANETRGLPGSRDIVAIAQRRAELGYALQSLSDQVARRAREGFDPGEVGTAKQRILAIADEVLGSGKGQELFKSAQASALGFPGLSVGNREGVLDPFQRAQQPNREALAKAEVTALQAVIGATMSATKAREDELRAIAASVDEATRRNEMDYAAAAAQAAATRSLEEMISAEQRRLEIIRSGDEEALRRFELEQRYADLLNASGDAASRYVDELVRIEMERARIEAQARASTRDGGSGELQGPLLPALVEQNPNIQRYLVDLQNQKALFGLSAEARELRGAEQQLVAEGASGDQIERARAMIQEIQSLRRIETVAFGIGDAIASGLERAVFQGGKLRDILRATLLDLYQVLFRTLVSQPIAGGIGAGLSSLFGGIFAPGAAGAGDFVGPPRAFASGGFPELITRPTTFPMRGGRTGRAGESGPEVAIAPLRRTSRGELGVSIADGAGRGGDTIVIQNTFNGVPDQQTAQVAGARVRAQLQRALRDRRGGGA